ncbi:MAG: type II secretion system protein, partial [Planctomycetes bacterium]|nr:type II secretion system protein [Planctomycetota bacterium]
MWRPPEPTPTPARGFSLIELLLVITIVGILLALMMGGVGLAWECARDTQCKHNLN